MTRGKGGYGDARDAEPGNGNAGGAEGGAEQRADRASSESGDQRRGGTAQDGHREQGQEPAAPVLLRLARLVHAQQLVGLSLRNSPAQILSASLIVRYGAHVSATSSTVIPALMA